MKCSIISCKKITLLFQVQETLALLAFQLHASSKIFSQKTGILVMGIDIAELLLTLDQC